MRKLLRGIVEFRTNVRSGVRDTFRRLALGQSPDALFIACSDSRVVPNLFASTEPGDLFVVRNVGNLIPPCATGGDSEAAALEFAIVQLRVSDIVVCGHSSCGAMRALLDGRDTLAAPHLRDHLRHGEEPLRRLRAGARMKAELPIHDHLSQFNVLQQIAHLRTYPLVRESGVRLHAWWFDIAEAEVLAHEESDERFVVIDAAQAERILARL